MSQITAQVHNKFKIFAGSLDPDHSVTTLGKDIVRFVNESKVAAKSVGIEYVESAKRVVISLGYRSDEPYYPVAVTCVSLGKVDKITPGTDFSMLEKALTDAAAKVPNTICHDLYVTEDKEFLVLFMSHKA